MYVSPPKMTHWIADTHLVHLYLQDVRIPAMWFKPTSLFYLAIGGLFMVNYFTPGN